MTMNKGPYVLVYQVGIANLFDATGFDVSSRRPQGIRRVEQHAYSVCEYLAAGLILAGVSVVVCHCDMAGDCMLFDWQPGPGDLWRDKKHPPAGAKNATVVISAKPN